MEKPNKKDYISEIKTDVTPPYYLDLEKYLDYCERLKDPVFRISILTPYTVEDINDFLALTGIGLEETEKILLRLNEHAISNLKDVNTLCKMGFIKL